MNAFSPKVLTMPKLVFALLLSSLLGGAAEAEPVRPLWETSRLAGAIRQEMATATPSDLEHLVAAFRERLMLTPVVDGVELASDLELAVRFAVALQLRRALAEFVPTPMRLAEERDAAFVLYTIGHRYETVDNVRFAVESLAQDKSGAGEALAATIRLMRRYGANWFHETVLALESGGALDAPTFLQRGVVALREGDPNEASILFSKASSLEVTPMSLRLQCDALLESRSPELHTFATELRDRLIAKEPRTASIFDFCIAGA